MRGRIPPCDQPNTSNKRSRIKDDHDDNLRERLRQAIFEQEQAFLHLVEERRSQVRRIEEQARDIQAQLLEAQRKLSEAEAQLSSFRERTPSNNFSKGSKDACPLVGKVKTEPYTDGFSGKSVFGDCSALSQEPNFVKAECMQGGTALSDVSVASDSRSSPTLNSTMHNRSGLSKSSFKIQPTNVKLESGRLSERKETMKVAGCDVGASADLVCQVGGKLAPSFINVPQHLYISSQHKRKLRSLEVNPISAEMCVTSALDGLVNTWKIEGNGDGLSLIGTVNCLSPIHRKWPENLAWHPAGESLLACYNADGRENQIAVISSLPKAKVEFLEERPHEKGIINCVVFLPWNGGTSFATGGCDHGVVFWRSKGSCQWEPEILHKSLHTSAVMGVAGMRHKPLMLSAGVDRRIVGFDTEYGRSDFRFNLDTRALGMLPNPVDPNLYMVQTGALCRQLRLFDLRMQRSELHVLGWKQESSESHSALISQSWSPDGFYIVSGSVDPKIHIFDIRYNSKEPSQSIQAHRKRVFKAQWHHRLPLLLSISSDLNVGLLKLCI